MPPKVIRPELVPVVPRETPDAPVNAPLVPVTVLAQVKALLTVIALVIVPAVAGAVMVHVPEVDPQRVITPLRVPATPTCTPAFIVNPFEETTLFPTVPA